MKQALFVSCVGSALLFSALAQAAVNESYVHVEIADRSELDVLTTLVSIADVRGMDVWAFATESMLERLQVNGYEWDVLPYPDRSTKIDMAKTVDDLRKTWRSYPTYEQYVALMQQYAREHSDICRLVQIGETQDNRQLLALKISDNPDQAEDEPEVFYSATMHGNEPTGYVLMLRLINEILTGYGENSRLTNLTNNTEIWINPLANPDGTYAGGNHTVKYATRALSNGVNLNRNFPDIVEGPHPDGNEWATETQAFMSFAATHKFTLSANFHTGKEVVNYPWDTMPDRHPEDAWFASISRAYAQRAQADGWNKYFTDLDHGITFAVGTQLTLGPPHRSVRARLSHTAPVLGSDGVTSEGIGMADDGRW